MIIYLGLSLLTGSCGHHHTRRAYNVPGLAPDRVCPSSRSRGTSVRSYFDLTSFLQPEVYSLARVPLMGNDDTGRTISPLPSTTFGSKGVWEQKWCWAVCFCCLILSQK